MKTRRSPEERRRLRENPKPLMPRKHVEQGERKSFLQATALLKPKRRMFCEVIYYTGCRPQECHDLCPHDFKVARSHIAFECLKLREDGIFREVPVRPDWLSEAVEILQLDQLDPYECVWDFCLRTGTRSIKEAMKLAGIKGLYANSRGLRHSFCTLHASSEHLNPKQLQYWAGHKDFKTTLSYIGQIGSEEQKIAETIR